MIAEITKIESCKFDQVIYRQITILVQSPCIYEPMNTSDEHIDNYIKERTQFLNLHLGECYIEQPAIRELTHIEVKNDY